MLDYAMDCSCCLLYVTFKAEREELVRVSSVFTPQLRYCGIKS